MSFSALQRAENSSMLFPPIRPAIGRRFSALQRAENSSILRRSGARSRPRLFQCSSASRKFLNTTTIKYPTAPTEMFQCSSASRKFLNGRYRRRSGTGVSVSVLFSEPKIPQCQSSDRMMIWSSVSVLFSEPKIPQSMQLLTLIFRQLCFSALQRAENSSIQYVARRAGRKTAVSVLFSEPKIPQYFYGRSWPSTLECFSALQRAENSSI